MRRIALPDDDDENRNTVDVAALTCRHHGICISVGACPVSLLLLTFLTRLSRA